LHAVVGACFAGLMATTIAQTFALFRETDERSIVPFRQLLRIREVVGDRGVLAALPDPAANLWAMYFLRNLHVRFSTFVGYPAQTHVMPFMQRAEQLSDDRIGFVLTEAGQGAAGAHPIWSGTKYALWAARDAGIAFVTDIRAPNGTERWAGSQAFWLGTQPAEVAIDATADGWALLSARFVAGPSLPQTERRHMQVRTDGGAGTLITLERNEWRALAVPVHIGRTIVSLQALDAATTATLTNGDTRTLLIGVQEPRAKLTPAGSSSYVASIHPISVLLQDNSGEEAFWVGGDPTEVEIFSERSGQLRVMADAVAAQGPPIEGSRRLLLSLGSWSHELQIDGPSSAFEVRVPVEPGLSTLSLQALAPPRVRTPTGADRRLQMILIKGLRASLEERHG
jgi:hypothetical protein